MTNHKKYIFKNIKLGVAILMIAPSMAIAAPDCSTGFWDDPLGLRTLSKASSALSRNPAPAFFKGSDISEKLPVISLGDGGYYLVGTPFDDYIYAPDGVVAEGLNGGYDTFLMANPELNKPGENRVAVAAGSTENNNTTPGDRFIVGDNHKRYFAGKNSVNENDNDVFYIDKFDKDHSVIRLHGKASDYRLVRLPLPLDLDIGFGTAIVSKDTCDTLAYVRNVQLFNTSGAQFEYASTPSSTTAVSTQNSHVNGIFQLGGNGSSVWFGTASTTDANGNTYSTFGASTNSINGATGNGSFFITKHGPTGEHLWTKKHGTNRGTGPNEGGQSPMEILVYGNHIYIAGLNFGNYGSYTSTVQVGDPANKPNKLLGLADGIRAFVGKYSLGGDLVAVKQHTPTESTSINPSWVLEVDNAGDLYFGGSTSEGINIPFATAYVMKIDGKTLDKVQSFGTNGAKIFNNGPATEYNDLTQWILPSLINNLQISNFTYGIKFVADNSGTPGQGDLIIAGVSDNGSFFGSESGWNSIWYTKLDAISAENKWLGNYVCTFRNGCSYTGGYSLSSFDSDLFMWGMDIDSQGNFYIGGEAAGTISDTGHNVGSIQFKDSHKGDGDGLVVKINTAGDVKWIKHIGTSESDSISGLAIENDIIYVAGTTKGALGTSNNGENDVYAASIDLNGNSLSSIQLGTERMDSVSSFNVSSGKMYIGGTTEGSFSKEKTTDAGADVYLLSIDSASF